MKNVPWRSVTCDTTRGAPGSVRHANGGIDRSIAIATPHSSSRYGDGTKIDPSHNPVVNEKLTM